MSALPAVVLVALGIGVAVRSWLRTGELLAPGPLVVLVWTLSFGLYLLHLLPYPSLTGHAVAVIGLGLGALLVGMWVGPRVIRIPDVRWPLAHPNAWVTLYAVLGLLGVAWYVHQVDASLGWRVLIDNPGLLRLALGEYSVSSAYLWLQFFCIVAVLLTLSLTLSGQRVGALQWGLVTACALATWTTTDRTQFFTITITGLLMYVYRRGPSLGLGRFAGAVTVAAGLLVTNFLVVGSWIGKGPEDLGLALSLTDEAPAARAATTQTPAAEAGARGRPPERASAHPLILAAATRASTLYLYATASYPAFGLWIESDPSSTHGLQIVYPLARLLERLDLLPVPAPPAIPPFVTVATTTDGAPLGFNGYTFLFHPYSDFGAAGVALYCLALGVMAGVVHAHVRRRRNSALGLLLLGQIALGLTLSIFVNKFSNTASWYILVMTVLPFAVEAVVERTRRLPRVSSAHIIR